MVDIILKKRTRVKTASLTLEQIDFISVNLSIQFVPIFPDILKKIVGEHIPKYLMTNY